MSGMNEDNPSGPEPDHLFLSILRTLRLSLHSCPEPANREQTTAAIVETFLRSYGPDLLVNRLGGHGLAAVYEGQGDGPTVLIRAELDALAIEEPDGENEVEAYAAHRCGHDAHMTMVAGLAPLLHRERPQRGRVVLLFQPAEETGEGAARVIDDPQFQQLRPDVAFALHNLPGFPIGAVVARAGTFCSASVGMRVTFHGRSSHAGEPEKARSPGLAIARLIEELPTLKRERTEELPYRLATVTHATLGRESFGTTPGSGELRATLRAGSSEGLRQLCDEAEAKVCALANKHRLTVDIDWQEGFPDTRSDPELVDELMEACAAVPTAVHKIDHAFRWSEDFGHFGRICPLLFYGLGIGEEAVGLHAPTYTFPDECLEVGVQVHHTLLRRLLDPSTELPVGHQHSTPTTRSDLSETRTST